MQTAIHIRKCFIITAIREGT